jgi:hypothetical protein
MYSSCAEINEAKQRDEAMSKLTRWAIVKLLLDGVSQWEIVEDDLGFEKTVHSKGYWYDTNCCAVTISPVSVVDGELVFQYFRGQSIGPFFWIFVVFPLSGLNNWMVRKYKVARQCTES